MRVKANAPSLPWEHSRRRSKRGALIIEVAIPGGVIEEAMLMLAADKQLRAGMLQQPCVTTRPDRHRAVWRLDPTNEHGAYTRIKTMLDALASLEALGRRTMFIWGSAKLFIDGVEVEITT